MRETLEGLGKWFKNYKDNELGNLMRRAEMENPWFTEDSLTYCFNSWANTLTKDEIDLWLSNYSLTNEPKTIGLIPAGNIPLVGLHDLLCVLASGHSVNIKLSTKDSVLMKACIEQIRKIDPSLGENINVVDRISDIEAIIATGSDNTFRYFENYFGHLPHVFRKNRNSIAIVSGDESDEELARIGDDIFTYFGLGCRNITHILFPDGYNTNRFFEAILTHSDVINHNKYANNYTYHNALYLMNKVPFLDNNFLMLKESNELYSPIGVMHHHFYKDQEEVETFLDENSESIQCIVSQINKKDYIPLGESQKPKLGDYADMVDTMSFLTSL